MKSTALHQLNPMLPDNEKETSKRLRHVIEAHRYPMAGIAYTTFLSEALIFPVRPDALQPGAAETISNDHPASTHLPEQEKVKRIRLRSGNHLDFVDIADLYCIEAQRAYCKIYFRADGKDKAVTMSRSLTGYAAMLPDNLFYRVHKSYLVNCSYIGHVITSPGPAVVLSNGTEVPVSRRRYASLLGFLSSNYFGTEQLTHR